jgi:excisionase family DNA binding protein
MTAIEPQVAETGRYSIEEAAAALGIHRNTLRRLTKDSKIRCGFRRHNMRRFYLGSEIKRFWKSYY